MFAAGTYADRRARLAATVQSGILLFLGNGESPMNYTDNTYPFRQDSTWLYYFGIDLPGLAAIVDIDEQQAKAHGVRVAIEPINRYETGLLNTVTDSLHVIDEIGADKSAFCLTRFMRTSKNHASKSD